MRSLARWSFAIVVTLSRTGAEGVGPLEFAEVDRIALPPQSVVELAKEK